ncbi:DEAD/DEAH box helicase [Buchnera aphidicola]|uniref:DEAD/DEAH box helicase n=1 Tax=Buchnera aphidicola TaxID=9 RepID=UPI00094D35BF|nr:DEAD/DEAH box helicase [Buchnera aphidicola]
MTQIHNSFSIFGLNSLLLKSLDDLEYQKPSPIQSACIPHLLLGKDVLGMAQTGSGKTAAFALPLLHNIKAVLKFPQILVLTPTRELAVQVAEAFSELSKYMHGIHVLPLYGGQKYEVQLRLLRQGPQIVVGTPGRLLDHLKRGTLSLTHLKSLVLDEADEMLRMGFIEDVENIMSKIPKKHQTALFSATMPEIIRRISKRFMVKPIEIKIQSTGITRPNIQQSYWLVYGKKTEALIRFLEMEDFSATIIFVKTKNSTLEVAEVLEKNGYNCAALNGDMNQSLREQTLDRLRSGKLDILIATDVAARGLDVDRISFVINYDIPMDAESYVHRIGRTGRAGRTGKALLFVEHRERRLLRNIERIVKLIIPEVILPKSEVLSQRRLQKFSEKIQRELDSSDLEKYRLLLPKLKLKVPLNFEKLSAALLKLAQGERPLIVEPDKKILSSLRNHNPSFMYAGHRKKNTTTLDRRSRSMIKEFHKKDGITQVFRIEIGKNDGIEARHIVGAIANEGNISSQKIGNIRLYSDYSIVELPKNISNSLLNHLSRTRILNKRMGIKRINYIKLNNPRKVYTRRVGSNLKANKFKKN